MIYSHSISFATENVDKLLRNCVDVVFLGAPDVFEFVRLRIAENGLLGALMKCLVSEFLYLPYKIYICWGVLGGFQVCRNFKKWLFLPRPKVLAIVKPRANALDLSTVQALNMLSAFEHPVESC